MNIRKLVKSNIVSLRAYQAEEIPCRAKLDANESPYGFTLLKSVKTNRYPDPEAKSLRALVARDLNAKAANILHGNGSDELIYNLIAAFGGPVLYPVPTFSMYGIIAQVLGEKKVEVPLDDRFDLDLEKALKVMKTRKPKLVFLSSPNNPTGNSFSRDRIMKIIRRSTGLVVVDEAYQPFSGSKSYVPLIKQYRHLVVLRTLSKIGLAGLRMGFMIAHEDTVHEVNKCRLPFNVNSLSQTAALNALKDKKRMQKFIEAIVAERKRLYREMKKMESIVPYPSDANFILLRVDNAEKIYKRLLREGVLVRNMTGAVENSLRVTIGTPKENSIFLKTLKQVSGGRVQGSAKH
jgi:histidinol-phosphate aminotransferase